MTKCILILLLSLPAYAGIRVKHGGGGYSEMRALSVLARMEKLFAPCLRVPERCVFTAAETRFLNAVEYAGGLNTSLAELGFNGEPAVTYEDGFDRRFTIPSTALYVDAETPKPVLAIGEEVLTAWFMRPSLAPLRADAGLNEASLRAMSARVLRLVDFSERAVALEDEVKMHAMSLSLAGAREVLLTLENPKKSVDITDSVVSRLPCGKGSAGSLRLTDIGDFYESEGRVEAKLSWFCKDRGYRARAVIKPDAVRLDFNMQVVALEQIACDQMMVQP